MTTALLIIDMQTYFAPMTTHALPNITTLITHFQSLSLPTLFTQHGHTPAELTSSSPNQLVRKWGPSDSIATGTPSWELTPEIKALTGASEIVAKNTYDAFINTKLEEILREKGVERVVVCGVMTDCCCDTTARAAFNRGFETWLVEDACGSANERQHEAGLRAFGYAFGEVLKTKEVLGRVK
ncbi:hypothetical protein MMC30_004880 [Trapelia coarctata]|nr:hypothetical protein [Trapelia coarctata]